jgi:sterol desaturase/sphingolipid hydroxylase (fatty acid hydroxylase superfamily)
MINIWGHIQIVFNKFPLYLYLTLLIRNYLIMYIIEYMTKKKYYTNYSYPTEKYYNEYNINLCLVSIIELITNYGIQYIITIKNTIFIENIIYIVPIIFIFDFIHYCIHYILHNNKYFYNKIHSKHHEHNHTILYSTYYKTLSDTILLDTIPIYITFYILNYINLPISLILINTFFIKKTITDINNHNNKKITQQKSLNQYNFLYNILNIQTTTQDNDLHHKLLICNYGKMTILWDKVFGTYNNKL